MFMPTNPSNPSRTILINVWIKVGRLRLYLHQPSLLSPVSYTHLDVYKRQALRLTIDEYKEFRAKDAETIERLGVKIRNLEVAASAENRVNRQAPNNH